MDQEHSTEPRSPKGHERDGRHSGDLFRKTHVADVLRVGASLKGIDVVDELKRLKATGRKPGLIAVDNGSEFTSKELETWCYLNDVKLDFIRPGKPVENCFIESFNGQLRKECRNANLFFTLAQAEKIVAVWEGRLQQSPIPRAPGPQ